MPIYWLVDSTDPTMAPASSARFGRHQANANKLEHLTSIRDSNPEGSIKSWPYRSGQQHLSVIDERYSVRLRLTSPPPLLGPPDLGTSRLGRPSSEVARLDANIMSAAYRRSVQQKGHCCFLYI